MSKKLTLVWCALWLTLYAVRMLTPNSIGAHTFGAEPLMLLMPFAVSALREEVRR